MKYCQYLTDYIIQKCLKQIYISKQGKHGTTGAEIRWSTTNSPSMSLFSHSREKKKKQETVYIFLK